MPPTTPDSHQTPTEPTTPDTSSGSNGSTSGPLSFVPHQQDGSVSNPPSRFRTSRYGELEADELLRLLDSIEDERARSRFRESIYISVFIWMVIAWLAFYGPKYLWHAPKVRLASDVIREHELTTLTAPVLMPHMGSPAVHPRPTPPPTVDSKTLRDLRAMEHQPPPPAAPSPSSVTPPPAVSNMPTPSRPNVAPLPSAPQPVPTTSTSVPEAPRPQPNASGNPFAVPRKPDYTHTVPRSEPPVPTIPLRGGGALGSGAQILSDTQGVDFSAWGRRLERQTSEAWMPMLPEEVYPPLSKRGTTVLQITVLPDGTIADMKLAGSTHDDALNRAAWGSITSQGKLPPLPKDFHGPNVVVQIFFVVGDQN